MLQIGWGIDGYIELKPDWNGSRDAMAAAAEAAVGVGGVGVAGEPTGKAPLPVEPIPALTGVAAPPPPPPPPPFVIPCDEEWSLDEDKVLLLLLLLLDGVMLCELPFSWEEPRTVELEPGSRFWLRSFSSRRHFARRLENQT